MRPRMPGRSSAAFCSAGTSSSTRRLRGSSPPPSRPRSRRVRLPGHRAGADMFPRPIANRCSDNGSCPDRGDKAPRHTTPYWSLRSSSARGSGPRAPRPGPARRAAWFVPVRACGPKSPGSHRAVWGLISRPPVSPSGFPPGFPSSALRFFPLRPLPLVSLRPASSGSFPSAVTVRFRSPSVSLRVPFPLSNPDASTPAGRFRGRWSRAARTKVTSFGTAPPAVVCARVGLRSCVRPGAGGAGTVRRGCGRRRGR